MPRKALNWKHTFPTKYLYHALDHKSPNIPHKIIGFVSSTMGFSSCYPLNCQTCNI